MMERAFTVSGLTLIFAGLAFTVVMLIAQHLTTIQLEEIPRILFHIYRRDSFFFATSPILILDGIAMVLHRMMMDK